MKYIKQMFVFLVVFSMLSTVVFADGLSIQLKRTNPGIAGEKSAELIFDIVNTDFNNKIEGFLFCKSPDDAIVSGTTGVGSGSGAQYVGEKFIIDFGPSQKAMTLTLEADTPGDKRTGCIVKYAPFKETTKETVKEETVNNVTTNVTSTVTTRQYIKLNGNLASTLEDSEYREIRLDKTVPFVSASKSATVKCPEGKTDCKASEVDISGAGFAGVPIWVYVVGVLVLMGAIFYLFGRTSK